MDEIIYKTRNLPDEQSTLEVSHSDEGKSLEKLEDIKTNGITYRTGTLPRDEATLEVCRSDEGKAFEKLEDIKVITPGLLLAKTSKTWTWRQPDLWTVNASGRLVMRVAENMSISADNEGNWFVSYQYDIYVDRHRWVYSLDAKSANGTLLFTLVLPTEDRNSGRGSVFRSGVSPEIRRDYNFIYQWFRRGSGQYWD